MSPTAPPTDAPMIVPVGVPDAAAEVLPGDRAAVVSGSAIVVLTVTTEPAELVVKNVVWKEVLTVVLDGVEVVEDWELLTVEFSLGAMGSPEGVVVVGELVGELVGVVVVGVESVVGEEVEDVVVVAVVNGLGVIMGVAIRVVSCLIR